MFSMNRKTQEATILVILAVAWCLAAYNPLDRSDWLLENLLVFITFSILALTRKLYRFSMASYWLLCLFMCMHLYGSHYTYAETPLGYWAQDLLATKRNHYDRVVHFCFGFLLVYPFMELLAAKAKLNGPWLYVLGLSIILSMSALYELAEMIAALVINPELGTAFLGTQGDEWDAQKDTGLAFIGAIIAQIFFSPPQNKNPI
jgi:putative membrane protein